jgi:hypothetical protein
MNGTFWKVAAQMMRGELKDNIRKHHTIPSMRTVEK